MTASVVLRIVRAVTRSRLAVVVGTCAVAVALGTAGCGGGGTDTPPANIPAAPTPATGAVPWPAPPNPMQLTVKAGLVPETHEYLTYHVHAHLDVFVNAKPVVVPAGIGIDITNPAVRHAKAEDGSDIYGGISPPCDKPCISPLHTHDTSGVLHTESKSTTPNTLGQFFTQWDVKLDESCVGGYCKPKASILIYVNGKQYDGDPTQIGLADHTNIVIVIGTAPVKLPVFNWG
jgi:hypothetical protein